MKRDQGEILVIQPQIGPHQQIHNVTNRPDPTPLFRISSRDDVDASDRQGMRVIYGQVRRIWKGLLPRLEVLLLSYNDGVEKVFSGVWNP